MWIGINPSGPLADGTDRLIIRLFLIGMCGAVPENKVDNAFASVQILHATLITSTLKIAITNEIVALAGIYGLGSHVWNCILVLPQIANKANL